jgi:hypothetical protein
MGVEPDAVLGQLADLGPGQPKLAEQNVAGRLSVRIRPIGG